MNHYREISYQGLRPEDINEFITLTGKQRARILGPTATKFVVPTEITDGTAPAPELDPSLVGVEPAVVQPESL